MKVLKVLLMVIGGIVLVIVGFIAVVFFLTDEAADGANELFAQLATGDVRGAYDATAPQLRERQSFEAFADATASLGLERFAEASWTNREITSDRATVEGTVTLTDGSEVDLRVALVDIDGVWQVATFSSPTTDGSLIGGGLPDLPDQERIRALVQTTLGAFSDALVGADFTDFHAGISALWRSQITAEGLQAAFQTFIDGGVTLTGIAQMQPEFSSPPTRDSDGALLLIGYMPTSPNTLYFRLRYIYEHPEWRLIGINFDNSPFDEPQTEQAENPS